MSGVETMVIVMARPVNVSVVGAKSAPWAPTKAVMGIPPSVTPDPTGMNAWGAAVILTVRILAPANVWMRPVCPVI